MMQMLDGRRFFGRRYRHSAEDDCASPSSDLNGDGVAVDHVDDSRHRDCCDDSGRNKKAHDIYKSFHFTFCGAGEFESGRAEDRGLVWAAKSTTRHALCEN
jgi:hypothetical protein